MSNAAQSPASSGAIQARAKHRSGFFFTLSVAILLIVLIGFAPTLYLRPLFAVPAIPGYVYLHGAVLTSWFVWFVVQTSLIRTGGIAQHRRLGVVGAVLGLVVIVASLIVTVGVVSRMTGAGLDLDADMSALGVGTGAPIVAFLSMAVWGNAASVLTFAVLLGAAILLRRRSETHKRLMLLASLSIVAPAIARISRWPGLGGDMGPFVPIVLAFLLAALLAYDFASTGRIHRATLTGGSFAIITAGIGQTIGASAFGQTIVRGMG